MAQIIDFKSFTGKSRRRDDATSAGEAQILFFLGVRYERMPDASPAAPVGAERPARAKRAPKRRA